MRPEAGRSGRRRTAHRRNFFRPAISPSTAPGRTVRRKRPASRWRNRSSHGFWRHSLGEMRQEDMTGPELKRRLLAGDVGRLYLIVGEESVLREEALAAIRDVILGSDDANVGAFNSDVVYAD